MFYILHNVDAEKVTTLNSEAELVHFMRAIAIENDDEELSITCKEEALSYLKEYCQNLTLLIEGVQILSVELNFDCKVKRKDYDLGSLRLACDDRTFILDVVQSYTPENGDKTIITCDLDVDLETFPVGTGDNESMYNLKAMDFWDSNLLATLFVGMEGDVEEPDSITLFVKIGTTVKAINVIQD